MFNYSAYGLGIHSDLPFPELSTGNENADIVIRFRKFENLDPQENSSLPFLKITPNETILSSRQVGTFLIRNGTEINIDPVSYVEESLLRRYIIGTIMALLLYQRGHLVLHASSININGSAVAFLGAAGSGKSSLAATFYRNGYEIITDDISAIGYHNNNLIVFPGYPQIKLSNPVARLLGYDVNSSIQLDLNEEKRGYSIFDNFQTNPLALRQIYLLIEASEQSIGLISPQQSLKEIIRNSYPTRFGLPGNSSHFTNCLELINRIPIFRLDRTSSLYDLPLLVKLVEDNLN
jgi:hypothetical protein